MPPGDNNQIIRLPETGYDYRYEMKKLKHSRFWFVVLLASFILSCGEEGGLKGTLKIAITDAPIDADNVKAVNIVISNVEGLQNGKWKPFRYFEQPTGVNLLAYTGGKSVLLIDQYTNPGQFSSLRFSLNIAHRNSSLIVNPQSNVVFKNGTSSPLYMPEGAAAEILIEKNVDVISRGLTDITIDVDLRKSIQINGQGEYEIKPAVRLIETAKSGHIKATIVKSSMKDGVVAYVYKRNTFHSNELVDVSTGVPLYNAITSTALKSTAIGFGFLESGSYDLIFVKHNPNGNVAEMIGRLNDIKVEANSEINIEINLDQLGSS